MKGKEGHMRKDVITSMRNAAAVLLACAIVLLCFAWRSPAYASVSGSIELSCGIERAGEHVRLGLICYREGVFGHRSQLGGA